MTEEQWRAAWMLSEMAGDLEAEEQRNFVQGATGDPEVESEVFGHFEELESESSSPASAGIRIGDSVGRYILGEQIGYGGMGEVYSAEDKELRRCVALKFLPAEVSDDERLVSQIVSEARLTSRVNHPNVVTVYELINTRSGVGHRHGTGGRAVPARRVKDYQLVDLARDRHRTAVGERARRRARSRYRPP